VADEIPLSRNPTPPHRCDSISHRPESWYLSNIADFHSENGLPAHHTALFSLSYLDLGAEFDDPVRRDAEESVDRVAIRARPE
jgi:hypothetical protein